MPESGVVVTLLIQDDSWHLATGFEPCLSHSPVCAFLHLSPSFCTVPLFWHKNIYKSERGSGEEEKKILILRSLSPTPVVPHYPIPGDLWPGPCSCSSPGCCSRLLCWSPHHPSGGTGSPSPDPPDSPGCPGYGWWTALSEREDSWRGQEEEEGKRGEDGRVDVRRQGWYQREGKERREWAKNGRRAERSGKRDYEGKKREK